MIASGFLFGLGLIAALMLFRTIADDPRDALDGLGSLAILVAGVALSLAGGGAVVVVVIAGFYVIGAIVVYTRAIRAAWTAWSTWRSARILASRARA
jgi:NaMN:DMB phosphoribosyltransferase